jgi:hypothetical protein
MRLVNGLPIFSTSEEVAYKTCKLAHHFEYVLGYRPVITNRKLNVGIRVHEGMEGIYTGKSDAEIEKLLHDLSEARWTELEEGHAEVSAQDRIDFIKDRDMVVAMVLGYRAWSEEEGIDEDYETVEVEQHHYIEVPGAPCVMPIKLDLLQRNKRSGRLRIVDFKTAASFSTDLTKYQLSEQNGNYSLGIFALYGERPTELAYRELRKMAPSNLTKPPYYRQVPIRLTKEEMLYRLGEYIRTATERFTAGTDDPVSNPSACCGSWKNDWQAPCLKVHQGMTPTEALEASPKYAPADTYARYDDQEEL